MKAVFLNKFGSRDALIVGELLKSVAGEGEVLVNIKAAGVNPIDWKIREGLVLKRGIPHEFPLIPGWDMAGIVVERGYAARRFSVGDEVFSYCRRPVIHKGTYAEYIAIPECYLARKPKNFSFEQAAAVPLSALTAYQSLFDTGKLKRRETVFILGASGGVGSCAVQFAKLAGARVIALASRRNHLYLKKLGADRVIDYQAGDFREALRKVLPNGAELVLACVGGEGLLKAYDCVRKGGRLCTIVERGDEAIAQEKGVDLRYIFVEPNASQLELIRALVEKRKFSVKLSGVYPLEDVARAHEQIETSHTRGKIVLKI